MAEVKLLQLCWMLNIIYYYLEHTCTKIDAYFVSELG